MRVVLNNLSAVAALRIYHGCTCPACGHRKASRLLLCCSCRLQLTPDQRAALGCPMFTSDHYREALAQAVLAVGATRIRQPDPARRCQLLRAVLPIFTEARLLESWVGELCPACAGPKATRRRLCPHCAGLLREAMHEDVLAEGRDEWAAAAEWAVFCRRLRGGSHGQDVGRLMFRAFRRLDLDTFYLPICSLVEQENGLQR